MNTAPRFSVSRLTATLVASSALLAIALALGAAFGGEPLDLGQAFTPDTPASAILFSLRIPRVALAALVGAALAASGSTLQALMRNPLADPFGAEWKGRDTGMVILQPRESARYHARIELFEP